MKINNRLNNISNYHFKKIGDMKQAMIAEGKRIYDFSIGDPDLPVHEKINEALVEGFKVSDFNRYPPYEGIKELKDAVIKYYREVFDVPLFYDEIVILIGSKEGLSNIIPAVCDFGDNIVIPVPGYPVYETCAKLWGATAYKLALSERNNYLPTLEDLPDNVISRTKLFFINYPHNPTGAVADKGFIKEIKLFCKKNDIVLCNDSAYNEIITSGRKPVTILERLNKENCIEFCSLSKTYNMTGYRIGYAVGDSKVISALLKVKSNTDSGQFKPIQYAAAAALSLDRNIIYDYRKVYEERRRCVEAILEEKKIKFFKAEGTFYVWCTVPRGYTTDEFCAELLDKYGILITPGYTFGNTGHGYFRISLTCPQDVLKEAFDKIRIYN